MDLARLSRYLTPRLAADGLLPADEPLPIERQPIAGGRSNLTDLLRLGSLELVLRRPPPGPLPPRAHDVAREFRWLGAVNPVCPLAPAPYLLCEDPAVIGSPFYVMERRQGTVVREREPPWLAGTEAKHAALAALVDTLVRLHAVDVRSPALAALGAPAGFLERQVRGWTERWERARTTDVPELNTVAGWLAEHLPPDPPRPALVHGDFKLDNVMLETGMPGRVAAVLDWEMSALGDPLVDLGILLAYWPPTDGLGWPGREDVLERYGTASGRDLSHFRFYEVFATFKVAVLVQQLFARYQRGDTDDGRFAGFGARVVAFARRAARMTGQPS
jgi:aminoglycoside phosphotransferase (APT) family kinase protein